MLHWLVPQKYKKWSTLLGGLLVHLSIGSYYSFGNMSPYLTSYLREYDGIDVRYAQSIWIFTSIAVCYSVGSVSGGFLNSVLRVNNRLITLVGCAIMSAGVALTYFTIQSSFFLTLLTYGVITGIGTGMSYMGPMSIAMKWFPNSKGLANSVILFGYGGGAIIFDLVQTQFINPDNYSPDKPYSPKFPDEKYFSKLHIDLLNRVPTCFLLLGSVYLAMQVIGISMMSEDYEETNQAKRDEERGLIDSSSVEEDSMSSNQGNSKANAKSINNTYDENEINSLGVRYQIPTEGIELKAALRMKELYLLLTIMIFAQIGPGTVVTYYKTFGQTFIDNDQFLGVVGSVSSIFNASGRILWGFLLDRYPFKVCMLAISTILVATLGTIYITKLWLIGEIYLVWVCVLFFAQCGTYAVFPTVVARTFGQKNFTAIYGTILASNAFSSLTLAFIGTFKDSMGWANLFLMGAFLTLFAWILAFFFRVKKSNGDDI